MWAAQANVALPDDEIVEALFVARAYPYTDVQQMRALDLARRGESVNAVVPDAVMAPELLKPDPDCGWDLLSPSTEFTEGQPRYSWKLPSRRETYSAFKGLREQEKRP
ncbi:hypothetical protein RAA17_01930 [Komagataeibacter rhaeticus]|nr:hypothetical protein [Komagataeibacter rhaeticus]